MTEESSTTAGQIIVKFIADTAEFEEGYNKVDSSLASFGQGSADATSQAKGLQKQTEEAGKAAKTTTKETDELTSTIEKESDAAKKAAEHTKNTGDKIEETGKKAKNATNDIFGLNEITNKLVRSLSIVALGGALISAAKYMAELQDKAIRTQRNFQVLYGDIDKATDALYRYRDAERSLVGGDEDSRAQTYEAVSREFKTISDTEYGQSLTQQLVSYQDTYGISGAQTAYSLGEIMSKWGITEDKALETLNQIVAVSKEQEGNVSENISENLSALAQYDDMLLSMGMDITDALKYFQALDSSENRKGVLESMSTIEHEWTAGMSTKATAEEQIPIIAQAIQDAMLKISSNGDEDGSLSKKIGELKEELTNYQQIKAMSDGDILKSVLTGGTYSGVTGRNKQEVLQLGEIYQNIEDVTLPTVTNTAFDVEKSWSEEFQTGFANFLDMTGDTLSGLVNEEWDNYFSALKNRISSEFETNGILGALNYLIPAGTKRDSTLLKEMISGTGNTRDALNELTDYYNQQPTALFQSSGTADTTQPSSVFGNIADWISQLFQGPSTEVTDQFEEFSTTLSDVAGSYETIETTSGDVNDNVKDAENICRDTAVQMQALADATNNAAEAQERLNRANNGATSNSGGSSNSVSVGIVSSSRGGAGT